VGKRLVNLRHHLLPGTAALSPFSSLSFPLALGIAQYVAFYSFKIYIRDKEIKYRKVGGSFFKLIKNF
jgi:hypothetical protein